MKMNFSRVMGLMAARFADRDAILNVERNRRYSFADYHRLTNRIANALRTTLGVGAGDKFLLMLENDNLSLMHFPMFFKQAGTAVFTNYRDGIDDHDWQTGFVAPKVVFIETELLASRYDMLRSHGCTIVVMDKPDALPEGVLAFWDIVDAASDANLDVEIDVHTHTTLLRFTGGTTGRGKCAAYTIDALLACRDSGFAHPDFAFTPATRCLHIAPLSHGSMICFFPTLFAGGATLTLNIADLEGWCRTVAAEGVTHSFLVPTALYRLLEIQRTTPRDFSTLQTIVYGAAPMSPAKLGDLIGCFGQVFVQAYAATEVAQFVAVLGKADHDPSSPACLARLHAAGQVTAGVELLVCDDAGDAVALGEVGELRIRCRATIDGYFNNAEGTASEFENGFWKSGDLGLVDAGGYVFIVDRKKDMIITGGFNVYAVEVEAAIASHPAVLMCAVVGVPHEEWGEAVHAEVVLRDGASATPAQIVAHVREQLGGYKSCKTVDIVPSLPLSAVGKVLRRMVRDKYWANRVRSVA